MEVPRSSHTPAAQGNYDYRANMDGAGQQTADDYDSGTQGHRAGRRFG
jgi:hypothetical protein